MQITEKTEICIICHQKIYSKSEKNESNSQEIYKPKICLECKFYSNRIFLFIFSVFLFLGLGFFILAFLGNFFNLNKIIKTLELGLALVEVLIGIVYFGFYFFLKKKKKKQQNKPI